MNFKNIIAISFITSSLFAFGSSDVNGLGMSKDSNFIDGSYTIEEGDFFRFYVGLPSELPYKENIEYKTEISEVSEPIDLKIKDNSISGYAPEVDKETVFKFKVKTNTDLNKPQNFIIRTYEITVLNK